MLLCGILLGALSGTLWSRFTGPVYDDYSQIADGRYILAHGFSAVDTIAWTSATVKPPVVRHEWLYQVTAALLYARGGFDAMEMLWFFVRLGIFILIALIAYRRSGRPWVAAGMVLLLGTLLTLSQSAADHLLALPSRPQTLSILLLLGIVYLLEHGGRPRWGIIPLLILGANWHGGIWPIYLIVLCYYALRDRNWWLCLAPLLLFLSPAGLGIVALPFAYGSNLPYYNDLANEFGRTPFWPGSASGLVPFLTVAILGIGIWLGKLRRLDLGFIAVLLLLALDGQRFVIFSIVLSIPLLVGYLSVIEKNFLALAGNKDQRLTAFRFGAVFLLIVLPFLISTEMLMMSAIQASRTTAVRSLPSRSVGVRTDGLNKALDYVTAHGLRNVLNTDLSTGDYMAFAGEKPFIYNRTDVFLHRQPDGTDLWTEFYGAQAHPEQLGNLVTKYGASYLLDMENLSKFTFYIKSQPARYSPLFSDGNAVLYKINF
jgi:hypothetical protein